MQKEKKSSQNKEQQLQRGCDSFEYFVNFGIRIDVPIATRFRMDQGAVDGDLQLTTGLLGRLANDVKIAEFGGEFVRNLG